MQNRGQEFMRRVAILGLMGGLLAPLGLPAPALAATHSIATCADLQTLGANAATAADTISLTADLDCTGIAFDSLYSTGFSGTFDGQGHSVSNINLNSPGTYNNGFFSRTDGATIQNLTLAGNVVGSNATGGLIGLAKNTTVKNVTSHVDVTSANDQIGGLIGQLEGPSGTTLIEDVAVAGDITNTTGRNTGGIIGYIDSTDGTSITLSRVSYTGDIAATGVRRTGGFIGVAFVASTSSPATLTIQDSYSTGDVITDHNEVGGLIGAGIANGSSNSVISLVRVYTTGAVTGTYGVGGLFGIANSTNDISNHISITDSFATGAITGSGDLGGLLGANSADPPTVLETTNAYYDGPGTGQSVCADLLAPTGDCTRIDTAAQPGYFKGNHTNEPMASWDFNNIWTTIPGGYPSLIPADDGDGIAKADELAAPGSGDANADGIADAAQPAVASFPNPISGHYTVLETSCGSLYNTAVGAESTTPGSTDVAYTYPGGLVRVIATGCTPGATATITQTFFGLSTTAQYALRKWTGAGTYTTVPGAVFSATATGGQSALKAVYHITDGSALDDDGAANGTIVDPAGPAVLVLGVPNTGLGGPAANLRR